MIGSQLLPLIQSGFQDTGCLQTLQKSEPLSFRGIAGAYHDFPQRTGLEPYTESGGWLSWYHGNVVPPRSGRYRFWGYADNHLMVAINGEPVFEGSRRDSSFKELGISRTDNPALPCLIAPAGFACSDWIEVTDQPLQLDILFGEVGGRITSGLLLIEREGENYEETFWGQPKWPLFLTESPTAIRGNVGAETPVGAFGRKNDGFFLDRRRRNLESTRAETLQTQVNDHVSRFMKSQPNRRHFLRGTGALIALPALESLGFQRFASAASTAPGRSVQTLRLSWAWASV